MAGTPGSAWHTASPGRWRYCRPRCCAGSPSPDTQTPSTPSAPCSTGGRPATRARQCWPEALDRHQLRTAAITNPGPHRPSWCYGTAGIARARQLAGHATSDHRQADAAELALLGCLTDERQLAHLADAGQSKPL
jgi:hypothetical protein